MKFRIIIRLKFFILLLCLFLFKNINAQNKGVQMPLKELKLGIILFPNFDQLDVTGPYEIFAEFPKTKIYFISNSLNSVSSVQGIKITPNLTFHSAPQMDILFVPGGVGVIDVMKKKAELIQFIQKQTPNLKYLTSVCTGSLILGVAGELKGYKSTSHWLAMKYLTKFDAIPVNDRVVMDRNRITGAGVSSGFDLALKLGDILFGKTFVETQELMTEYHPKPLYGGVTAATATKEAQQEVEKSMKSIIKERDLFFENFDFTPPN